MKRLMTAAVAVTLMCGASAFAYAQDTQPAPASGAPASGASGSDQSTQGGMNPAPPNDAGSARLDGLWRVRRHRSGACPRRCERRHERRDDVPQRSVRAGHQLCPSARGGRPGHERRCERGWSRRQHA